MVNKDYTTNRYMGISWDVFHRDARALASKLMAYGPYTGIIAITRGGLVPAAVIARELNLRLVDTICISTYDDRVQNCGASILKKPDHEGEGMLVIDDFVVPVDQDIWLLFPWDAELQPAPPLVQS